MNYVEVLNDTKDEIEEFEIIKEFIDFCLDKLRLKNVLFNVIIIDNERIHELNRTYRNIDRPTDVITFALEDNKQIDLPVIRVLGDVYISIDKAKEQSVSYGHSLKRELCFLAVHGLLHLLGYDHETKEEEEIMFGLQKELLEDYGIKKS